MSVNKAAKKQVATAVKAAAKPPELTDWELGFVTGFLVANTQIGPLADPTKALTKRLRPFARSLWNGVVKGMRQ